MKKVIFIAATIVVSAVLTCGISTFNKMLGIVIPCILMIVFSFMDAMITEGKSEIKLKSIWGLAYGNMLLSISAIWGISDPSNALLFTCIAVTFVILWFTPHTAYFAAALLGCTGVLYAQVYLEEGLSLFPSVHFGCVVLFTLSTWARIGLSK